MKSPIYRCLSCGAEYPYPRLQCSAPVFDLEANRTRPCYGNVTQKREEK